MRFLFCRLCAPGLAAKVVFAGTGRERQSASNFPHSTGLYTDDRLPETCGNDPTGAFPGRFVVALQTNAWEEM